MLVIFSLIIMFSLLFAVIIFWLSGFFTKTKSTRIILSTVIPIVFSPATALVSVVASLVFTIWYYQKDFDKHSWDTDIDCRWMMTRDIINSDLIKGKSKLDVFKILSGDSSQIRAQDKILKKFTWEYEVGYPPEIINIDPDYLIVEFENDTVSKVWQWHP